MSPRPRVLAAASFVALCGALLAAMLQLASASQEKTVSAPDTAGDVGLHASLELDAEGHPVVSYFDETNGDLKVLHCDDVACSGDGESIVSPDTEGEVGRATSLALDGAGRPVVSYKDGAGALKVLRCGDEDCTSGNSIVVVDSAPSVERETSLVLDGDGFPVISYVSAPDIRLVVVHCGSEDCSQDNSVAQPDDDAYSGAYASVALDAGGNPVVAYRDAIRDDLKVLHCGNPDCTADNTISAPDSMGNVGTDVRLVLDAAGQPVIAYRDGLFRRLKLLRCGNISCTAGNSITMVSNASGRSMSLGLDSSGRAIVAYYGGQATTFEVVRCLDLDCTTNRTVTTLDAVGNIPFGAHHLSLALAAGDRPVVAYFDQANGDLKVIACADPACAGKPPTPTPTPPLLVGDANCSGVVSAVDATIVLQVDAGLSPPAACHDAADVDGSGVVNSLDASLILQFVAGLLDSLPP